MTRTFVPATPYARFLARERGIDLERAARSGMHGEVRARDVLALASEKPAAANATPLARRMAENHGIDLRTIVGSGFGGKIGKRDVEAAQAAAAAPAVPAVINGSRTKLGGMRRVVAERMAKAHAEIPPVTQVSRVNVTALMEARSRLNAAGGVKYSFNDFILKAVAKALVLHPEMLVSLDGTEIVRHENVHLGMAVALETGLIVPVIANAETLSLSRLSAIARDLAERARSGKLAPDEYKGNTFTVTNLGMFDIESFTPIINQPDAAILGVCSAYDELALEGGGVVAHKIMRLCLTYDHRLVDGAAAARFQQTVKRLLENPLEIVMEAGA